jgi:hypothetical protein
MCTRAVCALSHYLEAEGIATAGISLIREHTEKIKPPRALWVPFELGRPFGPPDHPEFQLGVVRALLDLFKEPAGPVLADYPLEAPDHGQAEQVWSCTLPLPPLPEATTPEEHLRQSLLQEVGLFAPWYGEALRKHGHTAFGLAGLPTDRIADMAAFVAGYAVGETPSLPEGVEGAELQMLRFIADDLKSFYLEAASMQPGGEDATAFQRNRWLYHDTWFGRALYDIRDRLTREAEAQNDPARGRVALVPNLYRQRPPEHA